MNGDPEPAKVKARPKIRDKTLYDSLPYEDDPDISALRGISPIHACKYHSHWLPCILTLLSLATLIVSSIHLGELGSFKREVLHPIDEPVTRPLISDAPQHPTGSELGHCGNSIEEARALGCIFDPMSWAWQRPE